jgi:hypothetical protein
MKTENTVDIRVRGYVGLGTWESSCNGIAVVAGQFNLWRRQVWFVLDDL